MAEWPDVHEFVIQVGTESKGVLRAWDDLIAEAFERISCDERLEGEAFEAVAFSRPAQEAHRV